MRPILAKAHRAISKGLKERLGRCYELSAKYVTAHMGVRLVHGSIQAYGKPRIHHAWVEATSGGQHFVYDAVLDKWMLMADYYRHFNAKKKIQYTDRKIVSNLLKHNHWGPWE